MTISNYNVESVIDSGTFSDVMLAKNSVGAEVVIKKVHKKRARRDLVLREIRAGRKLRFIEGIAPFHEHYEDDSHHFLVFDYVRGKNLFDFMEGRGMKPFSESEARHLFSQLVRTVMHAHSRGVFHLDLKLENILIEDGLQLKLIDWGFCNFEKPSEEGSDQCMEFMGSMEYCCPEILRRTAYSGKAADTFSLGVVLYIMLFAEFPWTARERVSDAKLGQPAEVGFPAFSRVSAAARDLVISLLQDCPSKRASLFTARQHAWMQAHED